MGDVLAIPLHLAVHVSGFGLAAGLAAFAVVRRNDLGTSAVGLLAGAVLLGLSSLVLGAHLADGMAWPVYVRAAGFAGIAIGVVGRAVPGRASRCRPLPSVGPAAPVAAHVVAAGAAGLAALAVLGGSLGRGRIVALLAAGSGPAGRGRPAGRGSSPAGGRGVDRWVPPWGLPGWSSAQDGPSRPASSAASSRFS
jgi:hypothetical protein